MKVSNGFVIALMIVGTIGSAGFVPPGDHTSPGGYKYSLITEIMPAVLRFFVYVFGAKISVRGNYTDKALAGLLVFIWMCIGYYVLLQLASSYFYSGIRIFRGDRFGIL